MLKWVMLMAHHTCHEDGDGPIVIYTPKFFRCFERQIIKINEFPYEVMDYNGDLDIPLFVEMQWGNIGKNFTFLLLCVFYLCFFVFLASKTNYPK